MADTAALSDFLQANALSAAQHRSRIDALRDKSAREGDINSRRGGGGYVNPRRSIPTRGISGTAPQQKQNATLSSAQNTGAQAQNETTQEETSAGNLQYQIYLLEKRGKELKKAAIKDEAAAESMAISNTWVDLVAGAVIETGKATLEIIIGFLILPAGFIIKTVKFFFDKQINALKTSSQKKDEEGNKLLAQAEQLKGRGTPLKRATKAIAAPLKNYISELLAEFFPLGFSPLVIVESAKEKQKTIYKLMLRAAFFCLAIALSFILIIILILLALVLFCKTSLVCGGLLKIIDIFGLAPETALKVITQ
ncbi:MAG: hypothetical protein HY981_03785 [Candidatus Magasanikbacteria bacterium]|nr:hypothetical protein [Candidatus Magasanikbacteria bacterium]